MPGDYMHFIHCKQTEFKSTCNMEGIVTSLTILYSVIVYPCRVIFDLGYLLLTSFNFNSSMEK